MEQIWFVDYLQMMAVPETMVDMIDSIECNDAAEVIIINNYFYHGDEEILFNLEKDGTDFEH
eukprot:10072640-Ditylum_brightwellii.AAC.1